MTDAITFGKPGDQNELESGAELTPRFNDQGLITAIAQDAASGDVLMLAWMNAEALSLTISTGNATYYSRSRQELWVKGATSGNTQIIKDIRIDCDQDAVLLLVEQNGGACHTGKESCFYRSINETGGLTKV